MAPRSPSNPPLLEVALNGTPADLLAALLQERIEADRRMLYEMRRAR
jgi:hypothetical protein